MTYLARNPKGQRCPALEFHTFADAIALASRAVAGQGIRDALRPG